VQFFLSLHSSRWYSKKKAKNRAGRLADIPWTPLTESFTTRSEISMSGIPKKNLHSADSALYFPHYFFAIVLLFEFVGFQSIPGAARPVSEQVLKHRA
jgi:hypothetical protein